MVAIANTYKPDTINQRGKLREKKSLSRKEAAEKLGCTQMCLSYVERKVNPKKPSIDLALKMCGLYGCTLEDIYPAPKKKKTTNKKTAV